MVPDLAGRDEFPQAVGLPTVGRGIEVETDSNVDTCFAVLFLGRSTRRVRERSVVAAPPEGDAGPAGPR